MRNKLTKKSVFFTVLCIIIFSVPIQVYALDSWYIQPKNIDFNFLKYLVLGNIMEEINEFIRTTRSLLVDFLVNILLEPFNPDLSTIVMLDVVAGDRGLITSPFETYMLEQIHRVAVIIGFGVTGILTLGNIIFCAFGRNNQIKSSVPQTMLMSGLSIFGIYVSAPLFATFIQISSNLWKMIIEAGDYTVKVENFNVISKSEAGFQLLGITMTKVSTVASGAFLIFSIIEIFLVWKVIKGVFKFVTDFAEHFLTLAALGMLFPAFVSTIVNSGTVSIFKAYIRMIFCEVILMFVSTAFLDIFFHYLIYGVWFSSIINYILCLAFFKICGGISGWLKAAGLNVAQTSAGVANAIGGSLMRGVFTVSQLARGGGMIAGNVGNAMMSTGMKTGDYSTYARGEQIASISGKGGGRFTSEDAFMDMFRKNNNIGAGFGMMGNERFMDGVSFDDWTANANLPNSELEMLSNNGLTNENVDKVREFSNGVAGFYDQDDNMLGIYDEGSLITPTSEVRPDISSVESALGISSASYHTEDAPYGTTLITGETKLPQADGKYKNASCAYELYDISRRADVYAEVKAGNKSYVGIGNGYYAKSVKVGKIDVSEPKVTSSPISQGGSSPRHKTYTGSGPKTSKNSSSGESGWGGETEVH